MAKSNLDVLYCEPAEAWYDAFPLGNGSIGAMHYGGVEADVLQFSEGTFWSGEPSDTNVVTGAKDVIQNVRNLLLHEDYIAARNAAEAIIGQKQNYGTNLPIGNLVISTIHTQEKAKGYRRKLSMSRAISTVSYAFDDAVFTREVFVSHPDQVMAVRTRADTSACVTCRVELKSDQGGTLRVDADKRILSLTTSAHESIHSDGKTGVACEVIVRVQTDGGSVSETEDGISVTDANEVVIVAAVATSFADKSPRETCLSRINAAITRGFSSLVERHVKDFSELFSRVSLELPSEVGPDTPIDQRIASVCTGGEDPGLYVLLFQYGRYLLIGSSRTDSVLPAHLTGVWNDSVACRIGWTCDYHLDINTQMNYWIAETTNLSECHKPLFSWIAERLVPSGRKTARELYGCRGWVAHIVSNAWGFSAPGWSTHWGFFPTGGVWIASHLWYHYAFTLDRQFLSDVAYPVLKEAAEFFLDYLFENPKNGWLVSGPSCNPETAFLWEGERCPLSLMPTVDRVLLYELFSYCISAAEILCIDEDFAATIADARGKLPPYQIDKRGGIQEWMDDVENALPHHRHTSHLLGLFPYDQISMNETPELCKSARHSIESRQNAPGGFEEGSWARNNLTLFYARLHDGEKAAESLRTLIVKGADKSLMAGTKNAPQNAYEMDFNTGVSAGIAEMLLQSHRDMIHLLPALPPQWKKGKVTGLKARGGFEVDISWNEGRFLQARIRSISGTPCHVRADKPPVVSQNGTSVDITCCEGGCVSWNTEPGQEYLVTTV